MSSSARIDELRRKFDENPRRFFAPLANEYRKAGELEQAISLCRAHLPHQSGHISGHIVLAQTLYDAGELTDASQTFEQALELDPENLIALRYLGDIARDQGATVAARGWYERVLEVDPRNDEIAELIRGLDRPVVRTATPISTAQVAATATPTPARSATPISTSAIVGGAAATFGAIEATSAAETASADARVANATPTETPRHDPAADEWRRAATPRASSAVPTEPPATPDADVAFDWDAALDTTDPFSPPKAHTPSFDDSLAEPATPTLPDEHTLETESSMTQDQESLVDAAATTPDAESLATFAHYGDLGELEAAADPFIEEWDPAPTAASAPESGAASSHEEADAPALEFEELSLEVATQSPDHGEPTADHGADHARVEEFHSLDLEPSIDASAEDTIDASHTEATDAPANDIVADEQFGELLDAPTHDASAEADVAAAVDSLDEAIVRDELSTGEASHAAIDPLLGRLPALNERAEPAPAAFVTETMAELYHQQGFLEESLGVYRQLHAQRPDDEALASRMRGVEDTIASQQVEAASAAAAASAPTAEPTDEALVREAPTLEWPTPDATREATPAAMDAVHASSSVEDESSVIAAEWSTESSSESVSTATPAGVAAPTPPAPVAAIRTGPNAREFLAAIAARRPRPAHDTASHDAYDVAPVNEAEANAATAVADREPHDTAPADHVSEDDVGAFNAWLDGLRKP